MFSVALSCLAFSWWALAPSSVWAGAWTVPQGESRAFAEASIGQRDTEFDASGNPADGTYEKIEGTIAIEYGLIETLTVGSKNAYTRVGTDTDGDDFHISGLSEASLWARLRVWQSEGWIGSVQIGGAFRDMHVPQGGLALNDGANDVELRFLLGKGFGSSFGAGWLNVETAYRHRFDGAADQVKWHGTAGLRPDAVPGFLIMGQARATIAAERERASSFDQLSVTGTVGYTLTPSFTVTLGAERDIYTDEIEPALTGKLGAWISF